MSDLGAHPGGEGRVLEAGRELDALVAEGVMGLGPLIYESSQVPPQYRHLPGPFFAPPVGEPGFSEHWPIPNYSTSVSYAWRVVQNLSPARWLGLSEYRDGWRAIFSSTQGKAPLHPMGEAATMPHAICLAALKAHGIAPTPTPSIP